jgi:dCTP diphosphatase
MTDATTTVRELMDLVLAFSRERDWEQFHHPKDLGVALACEVGELLEHVRYRTNEQVRDALRNPDVRRAFGHELADCLWLVLRLAEVCDIDLAAALEDKVALAALKYPVDRVYGRPDKYTSYQPVSPGDVEAREVDCGDRVKDESEGIQGTDH